MTLDRRQMLIGGAALSGLSLAACDDASMKKVQARLNPTAAGGSAAPTGPAAPGAAVPTPTGAVADGVRMPTRPWTFDAFQEAMTASHRNPTISAEQFAAIQARKPAAIARIKTYLEGRFGQADENVLKAFEAVPREYFHYAYAQAASTAYNAYEENPKPWAIGHGSVLSDYLGQAYMSQLAAPKPTDVTLEIGTGSGFQSSLLSRIVRDAYTIMLTCVAQYAPPELFRQLKPGGKLIIPIGQPFRRGQVLYVYTKDAESRVHSRRDVGVFFIPMTGAMQTQAKPAGT